MFAGISLCISKEKLVIPVNWIKNFSCARMCYKGLRTHIHHKFVVFYSPNTSARPRFKQPIQQGFAADKSGVYMANIYNFFGT